MILTTFICGVAMMGLAAWLESRPRTKLEPRLIPVRSILFIGTLLAVLSGAVLLRGIR